MASTIWGYWENKRRKKFLDRHASMALLDDWENLGDVAVQGA